MILAHYYHLYADGLWQQPLADHLAMLDSAELPRRMRVGLVGSPERREAARACLGNGLVVAEADEGYEQVTLRAVRAYAQAHDGAVLYAHTKGAAKVGEFNDRWRRSMEKRVVGGWRENLAALADVDAVGCHWLTEAKYKPQIRLPIFGGNFWMARCDYVATLPEPAGEPGDAETWIGLGNPRVRDLLPGMPSYWADERWLP